MSVGVVGSGIGGLAAALRLLNKGYKVTVFETNDYPGGKLSSFNVGKYRFDAGPSLFTMPKLVDELFQIFQENPRNYFNYKKKKISCKYFWEDNIQLDVYGDKKLFFNEIENKLGISSEPLDIYLKRAKKKYELTAPIFLERSLHKFGTFFDTKTLKAVSKLKLLELNQNLHSINKNQLNEPHLIQIYDRFATYNGSSPFKTPGIMSVVQHLEQEFGTFIPVEGMNQITLSLFEFAKKKGVTFKMSQRVKEIIVEKGKAIGLETDSDKYSFDLIFSNSDIFTTYEKLLKNQKAPKSIKNQEYSSSAVIFYWGIKNKFDNLDLHNIFFSENYKSEFDFIFNKKNVSDDFTVYVNITSKDVPKDAPEGCENWFVMINTPPDEGQDWESIKNRLRKKTIEKLNKILKVNLETMIEEEAVMTPPIIAKKTSSNLGALYGSSSNNKMSAFLRHPNFNSKIKNLYFCGGSVHPGGGIPLCLLSAKIATDLIPNASNIKY